MKLSTFDISLLGGYLIFILLCGIWYHFRNKNAAEFMDGGRNLPAWMVAFSQFGTYISSIALLSFPALSFHGDWLYFVKTICIIPAAFLASYYFVGYFRKWSFISGFEHMSTTIGPWVSIGASCIYVAIQTIRLGLIMYLVSTAMSIFLGIEGQWMMIVTGISVTLYTYLGGIRAVVITDILQSTLLILGVGVLLYFLIKHIPADFSGILSIASEHGKLGFGEDKWNWGQNSLIVMVIFGFTNAIHWYAVTQSCVQRYIIAKSDQAARKALWLHSLFVVIVAALLYGIGTLLFVFYETHPEALAGIEGLASLDNNSILPHFIINELPAGLVGPMIAMILAAAMSSIDTEMNSAATLILTNVYTPLRKQKPSDKESKRILTLSSIAQGTVAILIGIEFSNIKNIYDVFMQSVSILGATILGCFLLSFFYKKISTLTAAVSILAGITMILWIKYPDWLPFSTPLCPFNPLISNALTTLAMLLAGSFCLLLTRKKRV